MAGLMKDKVVVITGGRRGLGATMAEYMLREGAIVWITSRTVAKELDTPLVGSAGRCRSAYLDVTDEQSVISFFEKVEKAHGRMDVLVNNAGMGVFKPLEETTLTEWQEVIQTNLTGLFLCSREAFKLMKKQTLGKDGVEQKASGGRIINIGSVSGYIPIAENGAYGASKYGVRGLTYILNEEGKSHNIRASIVNPGAVYTDIWEGREGFDPQDMLQPEDIAETILDIAHRPLHVRIDEVNILPPKGVL